MNKKTFLTNGEAMSTSTMFRRASIIDFSLYSANVEKLEGPYSLKVCRELSYEAWGIVFAGIINGEHGLSKYLLLPPDIATSPLCIACLLENDALFDLVYQGKISYTGIVRLAYNKGIWAH